MQVEYYKSWNIKKTYIGIDLDFRDWGLGIVFSVYAGRPYFSIQIGPFNAHIGVDSY